MCNLHETLPLHLKGRHIKTLTIYWHTLNKKAVYHLLLYFQEVFIFNHIQMARLYLHANN
jgi:hypothetical protein